MIYGNSFQRERTINRIDYSGMWTILANKYFSFTVPKRQISSEFLITFFLQINSSLEISKSFWDLLNCSSLKCLTKKAWSFLSNCSWKININSQKCSLVKPTNATQGISFFIPQQTEVLNWSIFSNMFKDDQTVMFLMQFLSEFHRVVPFFSWCWNFPSRFLSCKFLCFQESVHVTGKCIENSMENMYTDVRV